jgi:Lignostilbene-alpha,beta-dioxygenase and related enzymes
MPAMGDIAHDWYQTGLARIDVESGARSEFSFGADYYVGEPIFAPDPAAAADPAATEDRGWILAEVLDGKAGKSFLAVFDAGHLEDGPVAKVNSGPICP